MTAVILDRDVARDLIAKRRRLGIDQHDEVWEGVYFVAPIADNDHQRVGSTLDYVFHFVVDKAGLGESLAGANISDRKQGWKKNYRVPDNVVFLNDNPAVDCGTFWFGGPDFAVEIVSPRDRSRKKVPFYEQVGTRELLIVDRKPWRLTLYRLADGKLSEVGQSTFDDPQLLVSQVLPLNFRLAGDATQPGIEVVHHDGQQRWFVAGKGRRGQGPSKTA